MALVKDSITLDNIVTAIRSNNNIFWYVSRNGTVKKITIYNKIDNHNYIRNFIFLTEVEILNTNESFKEDWFGGLVNGKEVGGSGMMFDKYYNNGHFFYSHSSAFNYLRLRIKTNKNIVKTAKQLLEDYPEYSL